MTLDLAFFALAIPAVLFAAVSKAGFGSGAAFAASAILALVLPPGLAIGLMLPLLMLIDIGALKAFWGKWHWPSALWICIGAMPGVAVGAWLFTVVNADVFRLMIGVICLGFVAYQISQKRGWIPTRRMPFRRSLAAFAGLVGGFTSFVSHAGGPPVAVYLLGQGMSKTVYQSTTVLVFWVINIAKVVPYAALGIFTRESLLGALLLAPVAIVGTWLGVRAHHWMPERAFFILTYILLVLTGIRLIWVGLT